MTAISDPLVPPPARVSGPRRVLYVFLGLFFVGLAILGVILPLLPTTPFLLLASFFFVRSSPRLNAWLLRSRVFGPFLRDWQKYHGVRPHVKLTALTLLPLAVGASAYFGDLSWPLLLLLIGLALIGMIVVIRLPLVRPITEPERKGPIPIESGQADPLAAEPFQRQEA